MNNSSKNEKIQQVDDVYTKTLHPYSWSSKHNRSKSHHNTVQQSTLNKSDFNDIRYGKITNTAQESKGKKYFLHAVYEKYMRWDCREASGTSRGWLKVDVWECVWSISPLLAFYSHRVSRYFKHSFSFHHIHACHITFVFDILKVFQK